MSILGTFVIPQHRHHSTAGARRAFRTAFGMEWVGTDDELRAAGQQFRRVNPKGTCADFLLVMIETGDQSQAAA